MVFIGPLSKQHEAGLLVLSALKKRVLFPSTSLKKSSCLQTSSAVESRAMDAVPQGADGWKLSLAGFWRLLGKYKP